MIDSRKPPDPRIDYFDASALAKRYVEEQESDRVRALLAEDLVATSRITEIEVASALVRRCREGDFPAADRDRALGALRRDLRSLFVVEVTQAVSRRSISLLKRHSLRAADALQLASCLELSEQLRMPVRFVAYDRRLCDAALAEGLEIVS